MSGKDLITAVLTPAWPKSSLFFSGGLLMMFLQPGLNDLHEDLADNGVKADAGGFCIPDCHLSSKLVQ